MTYAVRQISIDPIANVHDGSGTHTLTGGTFVDVRSVAGAGLLRFVGGGAQTTSMLFQIDADVVPNWFAVAVPSNPSSLANPILFFHPAPAQAGYLDSDYSSKAGKWPQLFYYADRLGYQLDASGVKDRVVVMPFMTQASTADAGILAGNWKDLLTSILGVAPTSLTVASFSSGCIYSNVFRQNAVALPSNLAVWDFDGSQAQLGGAVGSTLSYAQLPVGATFEVPLARWAGLPGGEPASSADVHQDVIRYLFQHACWYSAAPAATDWKLPLAVAGSIAGLGLLGAAYLIRGR